MGDNVFEDLNVDENLYIDDYDITELVQLFDLQVPLHKEAITTKLDIYIRKFENQNNPVFAEFLEQARLKLINSIPGAFQGSDDDTQADQVLDDEYWTENFQNENIPNRKDMTRIVSQQPYSVLQRRRLNISQQKEIEYVQGQLNPNLKNTYTRILNIDSQYREIVDISENLCAPPGTISSDPWKGKVRKNNIGLDSPSDFTFDLSETLGNVVELQLYDVQLQRSWYVFSRNYGTNSFWVNGTQFFIKEGNWAASTDNNIGIFAPNPLAPPAWGGVNNVAPNEDGTGGIVNPVVFEYDIVTNKTTMTPAGGAGDRIVFFSDSSGNVCGADGGKRDYNLGWLLGFRQKSYTGSASYTSEALVDTFGTKYLYIILDDYNKNRITYNLLGMTNHRDNFKIPSYYNKATMTQDCSQNNIIAATTRPCRKGTPSTQEFFPIDNLTKAQQYTANSIIQQQHSKKLDRYFSPTNPNILAKIPIINTIQRGITGSAGFQPLFGDMPISNNMLKDNKRTYFGPVTIKRLHIQLIDDKGNIIDLNGMNWSFSLKVQQLYQY